MMAFVALFAAAFCGTVYLTYLIDRGMDEYDDYDDWNNHV